MPHAGSSPVKHAFVLTWESYGNMFSSFFLAKALAWDVELSWWGLNIPSDANDPLIMQTEKKIYLRDGDLQLFVHLFLIEDLLFFSHSCYVP